MAIERRVEITIYLIAQKQDGSPDHHAPKKILSSYDLPRELYERRQWVITWRAAWWQCKYPKRHIQTMHAYYDKKTGQNLLDPKFIRITTCKRMITKMKNKITEYEAARTKELFWDKDRDNVYQKGLRKLRMYQEELEQLQADCEANRSD